MFKLKSKKSQKLLLLHKDWTNGLKTKDLWSLAALH